MRRFLTVVSQSFELFFCMGRPIVQEFDDCIHVAEATIVDTFALDDTMYFAKLPYFGQLQMMNVFMFNPLFEKKALANFI